jgi:site-specific recombinase XerD
MRFTFGIDPDVPRNVDLPGDAPLFRSDRGDGYGEALTDSGMRQLFSRLGDDAGITGVRCSPHTVRHTAAVWLLANGANAFTVKEILGHTTLTITQRYVNFAQADIERMHKTHSPVDNMRRGRAYA